MLVIRHVDVLNARQLHALASALGEARAAAGAAGAAGRPGCGSRSP